MQPTDGTQRIKTTQPIEPKQPKASVDLGGGSDGIPINRTDGTDGVAMERVGSEETVIPQSDLANQLKPQNLPPGDMQALQKGYLDMLAGAGFMG